MSIKKPAHQIIVLILWIVLIQCQNYDRLFIYDLPPQKQILTLQKVVISTPILIDKNPQHLTYLQNEPYNEINNLVAVNITYSISDGFESQWPQEKKSQKSTYIVINDAKKLIQQQRKSPFNCKTSPPGIIFTNSSSFTIQTKRKNQASRIITNYEELFHEDNMILDVWKSESNENRNLALVIMSNGELIAAIQSHSFTGNVSYEFQKYQLANELKDASFNSQRYSQEKKIYLFSNEVQVEIDLKKSDLSINYLKIQQTTIPDKMIDYQWIYNGQTQPYLAILTTTKLRLYSLDKSQQMYRYVNDSEVGAKQINNFLRSPFDIFINENGKQTTNFKKVFFIKQQNACFIWENNMGLIASYLNPNNTFNVFRVLSVWAGCYDIERIPNNQNSEVNKTNFFLNSKNGLSRMEVELKGQKLGTSYNWFDQFSVPTGEIILHSGPQGNLIFVLGQTKIMGLRSWKFPKILNIENQMMDNLFIFGQEYVSVEGNRLTLGKYHLAKEQIVCTANPNYKPENQNAANQTEKTSQSNSQDLKNSTNQNRNLIQISETSNQTFSILIEYLAECNSQIIASDPYFVSAQSIRQYKYCRYKKLYTDVSLIGEAQPTKNNSSKMELILIVTFSFSAFVLLLGIGIWYLQKRKIGAFLEIQGMPVGSEDLEANPSGENNLNFKFN